MDWRWQDISFLVLNCVDFCVGGYLVGCINNSIHQEVDEEPNAVP